MASASCLDVPLAVFETEAVGNSDGIDQEKKANNPPDNAADHTATTADGII